MCPGGECLDGRKGAWGGRVVVACLAWAIAMPAFASDKPQYPTSIESYSRIVAGAKIIHIAFPSDKPIDAAGAAVDFDAERVERRSLKVKSGEP